MVKRISNVSIHVQGQELQCYLPFLDNKIQCILKLSLLVFSCFIQSTISLCKINKEHISTLLSYQMFLLSENNGSMIHTSTSATPQKGEERERKKKKIKAPFCILN